MADPNPPIIGNAQAFERAAKEVLARAEEALRQAVSAVAEVRAVSSQVEEAATARTVATEKGAAAREAAEARAGESERRAAAQGQAARERAEAAKEAAEARSAAAREAAEARAGEAEVRAAARGQEARERAEAAKQAAEARSAAQAQISADRAAEADAKAAAASEAAWERANAAKEASAARTADTIAAADARAEAATRASAARVQAQREAADARAEANMLATTHRTDEALRRAEQAPAARQQGQEAARQVREQQATERLIAANREDAGRGYQYVASGANESANAVERSALAMAEAEKASQGLGAALLRSAQHYGKFVVATAGLFGAMALGRDVIGGATAAQVGVQNLRRVMPGEVDPQAAMAGFASLSSQINVPINEAADATQRFARTFHNLPESLSAARVALGFTKLDAIGLADSVRYLQETAVAFHLRGTDLESRVADPLARLTQQAGVQPAQLMAALGAAPAVAGAHGDISDYLAFAAQQIRGGANTGRNVTTATIAAITNFIPRPKSQEALRRLLGPETTDLAGTNYTEFLRRAIEASEHMDRRQRIELSQAIGGTRLGGRVFFPLFQNPQAALSNLGLTQGSQGAFSKEMADQLGRVDERIKAIRNGLERLGIELARSGVVTPIVALARALGFVVDEVTQVLRVFNILPGPVRQVAASIGAIALAWRGMARFDVMGRLARQTTAGGIIGRVVPDDVRQRVVEQRAVEIQRTTLEGELERARAQQLSAAYGYQTADISMQRTVAQPMPIGASPAVIEAQEARIAEATRAQEAAYERFTAANQRVLSLEEQLAGLANAEVAAIEQVGAAKTRAIAAQAATNAATGAEAAVANGAPIGAPGMFWRDMNTPVTVADERRLLPPGTYWRDMNTPVVTPDRGPEQMLGQREFARTKGLIEDGGLLAMAGGAAKGFGALAKFAAPIGLFMEGMAGIEGFSQTHGNLGERFAGAGRQIGRTMTFGLFNGPAITGAENRAEGHTAASDFLKGLIGGAHPDLSNPAVAAARTAAITKRLNDIDASGGTRILGVVVGGPDERKASAEYNRLQGELYHEQALARAAVDDARAGATPRSRLSSYMGLNSKELDAITGQALLPMSAVGDDSGLGNVVSVAEAYAKLGHQKKRPDLLKKALDTATQGVQAISQELTDDLALAASQKDRDAAYAKAEADAMRFINSSNPAVHRQGLLLMRQIRDSEFTDYAQRSDAATSIYADTHRGRDVHNARRAEDAARNQYEQAKRDLPTGDPKITQARQKYIEAQNTADDAALSNIERDTAQRQAQATTQAGKDRALVAGLTRELAKAKSARHPDAGKIADLTNQLTDANQQLAQQVLNDFNARIDAEAGYLEAQTDDPLQQALIARRAVYAHHYDHTDRNWRADRARDRAQADQQVRQQNHQRAIDTINANQQLADAATDPGNSVALAEHAARAAAQTYHAGGFTSDAARKTALANMRKTAADTVRARQQAAYDDIQHNAAVGKLTTDMEVSALRRMLSTVHNNRQLRRQIEEQIYSLTHQDSSGLELQLGNIRLPTPYEVNRAIREAGGARGARTRGVVNNNVNINVNGDTDIGKMASAIDGIVGTSTRSALRAAGAL